MFMRDWLSLLTYSSIIYIQERKKTLHYDIQISLFIFYIIRWLNDFAFFVLLFFFSMITAYQYNYVV